LARASRIFSLWISHIRFCGAALGGEGGNRLFAIASANMTVIVVSVLTVSSIVDYVDLNGYGVSGKFTILLLLGLIVTFVSLALIAKRYWRFRLKKAEKRT
jgi:preprotein translocase subunit SecF